MGMPIAIWCLFTHSLSAYADLKLPSSKTVIKADINGNGIPDRVVATYFTRPVLAIDSYRAHTCKTVPGKFVRYTMYPDGQKSGKVIFEQQYGNILAEYWGHRLEIGEDLSGWGHGLSDDLWHRAGGLCRKCLGNEPAHRALCRCPDPDSATAW